MKSMARRGLYYVLHALQCLCNNVCLKVSYWSGEEAVNYKLSLSIQELRLHLSDIHISV